MTSDFLTGIPTKEKTFYLIAIFSNTEPQNFHTQNQNVKKITGTELSHMSKHEVKGKII